MLGDDFNRMAEQIERLVTAQRNLLGDVSHELRSPLARLIVALSLLKHGQGGLVIDIRLPV
jgi:signal transduction histidine kinase